MRAAHNCAPAGQMAGARGDTKKLDASVTQHGEAGKRFAVMLYNVGARSLSETQAAFDRRPSWRGA